jgi:hypothetical protein
MPVRAHRVIMKVAIRYLDSASVLHRNSPSPNALWEPLNHLFAMSAELALKAFLESVGVPERDLRGSSIRHSLYTLLSLAVTHGLRTSYDVADVILEMDEAHSSHTYRYVPRPAEGEVVTVYAARPASAFVAIQSLIDHCATDTSEVRAHTVFPNDWPPASVPEYPVTTDQLKLWFEERKSLREFFGTADSDSA